MRHCPVNLSIQLAIAPPTRNERSSCRLIVLSQSVADAIKLAVLMTPAERRLVMGDLRGHIRKHDVFEQVAHFLKVSGTRLNDVMPQPIVRKVA